VSTAALGCRSGHLTEVRMLHIRRSAPRWRRGTHSLGCPVEVGRCARPRRGAPCRGPAFRRSYPAAALGHERSPAVWGSLRGFACVRGSQSRIAVCPIPTLQELGNFRNHCSL